MRKVLYIIFNREVVAGDDGVITVREVATAWFVVFSLLLTGFGTYLAVKEKLTRDYIEMLIACYAMTLTLLGISTGKSSLNNFINAKYNKPDESNAKPNSDSAI